VVASKSFSEEAKKIGGANGAVEAVGGLLMLKEVEILPVIRGDRREAP
jgi:hypothetical protein